MSSHDGQVVLVTGGSRGIGRAVVQEFARRGATVVLTYASSEAAAQEAVALATQVRAAAQVSATKLDVRDSSACAATVEQVIAKHGRIDVLVNNAGVALDGLLVRYGDAQWDETINTNLRGAFALARAAARPMMKQRHGCIVQISSVVGEMGNAGQVAYAASKAGLIGMTKALARELASRGIRVNAVTPGFIETDMTNALNDAQRAALLEMVPLGKLGAAKDVASAVAFLCSEEASYITGEVLRVNGGLYM